MLDRRRVAAFYPLGAMKWILSGIAVFTGAKSFKRNPVIGSHFLNRCGLHVARVWVAWALFRMRLGLLSLLVGKEDRKAFLKEGLIVKKDFLPPELFAELRSQLRGYEGDQMEQVEGATRCCRVVLDSGKMEAIPAFGKMVRFKGWNRLIRYTSSWNRLPFIIFEDLELMGGNDQPDPQMAMHRDTFQPCMKAWLYLDDVEKGQAPYVYVPGSHRLTRRRLAWEYRQSIRASDRSWERPWDGSFRISDDELREVAQREPMEMIVPGNTLVIGNVFGFHRRGDASKPGRRMTLFMNSRYNPFIPLIVLFPALRFRIDQGLARLYLRWIEKSGNPASLKGEVTKRKASGTA